MLNLGKMKALWSVFEAGKEVINPRAWKMRQVSVNAIAGFLFALATLAKVMGYDTGIDVQTCADIAVGLLALANVGLTVATTTKLGVKPSVYEAPVREAEQPVPSHVESEHTAHVEAALPHDNEAVVQQGTNADIDEDVRQRAMEWARQHSAVVGNAVNGLQNDA